MWPLLQSLVLTCNSVEKKKGNPAITLYFTRLLIESAKETAIPPAINAGVWTAVFFLFRSGLEHAPVLDSPLSPIARDGDASDVILGKNLIYISKC